MCTWPATVAADLLHFLHGSFHSNFGSRIIMACPAPPAGPLRQCRERYEERPRTHHNSGSLS
jgi:hypothetical protein